MRILISKILTVFLLLSFGSELTVNAFTKDEAVILMVENDESKDEEKEEIKDKISADYLSVLISTVTEKNFYNNPNYRVSAFIALPEIPPDQA